MTAQRLTGPWLALALVLAAAMLAVAVGQVRLGGYLLAAGFALTAAARLALPARVMGALAVRSRSTDVIVLAVASVATVVLTATLKLTT